MKTLGYYNGEIAELEELRVPVLDRGLYFGDGIYDATYAANHVIYELDEHVERFFNSARLLGITLTKTREELKALLNGLIAKLDTTDILVYWQASRGTALRAHVYPDSPSNLTVMLRPGTLRNNFLPMKVITQEDLRFLLCHVKTLNLLPSVLAAEEAKRAGCEEAILHRGDRVTEGSHSNVHILQGGTFRTAPLDHLILPGVTRGHLVRLCDGLGIPVNQTPFTLTDLLAADEIIVTSAGNLCASVSHIDGKSVGGKDSATLGRIREAIITDFERATGATLPRK
jgi:D-alanine transaminase